VFFQTEQVQGPEPAVLLQPPVQFAQRFRIEPVDTVAPFADFGDQLRFVQYAEVLGDGRTADVEAPRNLMDWLAAIAQAIQNGAARGVGDGVKNAAICNW
jgi:hypothetical protein